MKKGKYLIFIMPHALLLLTFYVLQGLIFPYLRVFGLVPVLLPVVAAGVAIFEGRVPGGAFGLFAGILTDISFNQPAIVFTVLLTILGIVIGLMADTVLSRGFPTFFITSFCVLAIVSFVQMFSLLFFENADAAELIVTALYQTLYSLAFTIPIYFTVKPFGRVGLRD